MKSLRSGGESLHLVARSNFSHFRRARAGRRCCIMKNSVEASKMERVQGVTGLGKRYRGVLLDQFGVLHDGNKPYPEAIAAVEQMHREGMRIVIVSNSSRRSDGALDKIAKMGFKKEWFVGAITSGEITHQMLAERSPGFWEGLGTHALWFTWGSRGAISLDGTGVVATRDIARAEFILAHGTEALGTCDGQGGVELEAMEVEDMVALLRECAKSRPVPMIIANPDIVTVDSTQLRPMPGMLGRAYREAGGEVILMGKPARVIYDRALAMLGMDSGEVVAIGDSLEHDVAGAAGAGVHALFIGGGIHAKDVGMEGGGELSMEMATQLCEREGITPTMIADMLRP